jgi:hypothetical protein
VVIIFSSSVHEDSITQVTWWDTVVEH